MALKVLSLTDVSALMASKRGRKSGSSHVLADIKSMEHGTGALIMENDTTPALYGTVYQNARRAMVEAIASGRPMYYGVRKVDENGIQNTDKEQNIFGAVLAFDNIVDYEKAGFRLPKE